MIKKFLKKFVDIILLRSEQKIFSDDNVAEMYRVCEMVVAIRHCMMFKRIHADWMIKELLDKYGAKSVDDLADKAQQLAEKALGI